MKKSYMDKNNILSENIFSKIKKILGLSSSEEKKLKNNKTAVKKINNIINDLNSDVVEFENIVNGMYKDLGIDKKVNAKKYKLSDFIK